MSRPTTPDERLPLQNRANVVYRRYPVADGRADDMRSALASTLRDEPEPERLVGIGPEHERWEPYTASVFLEPFGERSFLSWHVEGDWNADDGRAVVEETPLFEALEPFLETDGASVVAPSTFARHPRRPSTVFRRVDDVPFVLGSTDGDTAPPDVVLFRPRLRPGLPTKAMNWLRGLMDRFEDGGRVERTFDGWTEPIVDEEGVHTETVFLDRVDGDCYLVNYLECESRERVWEAYRESDDAVALASEWLLRWALEDGSFVDRVPEATAELLVHVVNDGRP